MANTAKMAILRAKIEGVVTDLMLKTTADHVYTDSATTLTAKLATLAAKADLEALQQTVDRLGALGQKDKIAYADLEDALAALIDGKAEASALTEEINRAKAAEEANAAAAKAAKDLAEANAGRLDTVVEETVTVLNGMSNFMDNIVTPMLGEYDEETSTYVDAGKSIRTIANEELAKQLIPENAAEALNELQEIAAWIQSHPGDASAMNEAIVALQNKVDTGDQTVSAYVAAAIAALNIGDYATAANLTELAGRVTTAEGKITALEGTVNGLGNLATKDIITESEVDSALMEKINSSAQGNHSHANKGVLDGITAEKVAAWDAAEGNAKTHANDLNSAMDGRMQVVEAAKHTHSNKDVLDGISAANVASWNGKAMVYAADAVVDLADNEIYIQLV